MRDRPSPLQNRVHPDGTLHAVPARGGWMGNRGGRLHGADGRLGRARWKSRAWILCRLQFRGRHRVVMGESYTELFFLDEATALAAGHRPCFECRRADALAFAEAWGRAVGAASPPRAAEMDRQLHQERRAAPTPWDGACLPDGSMLRADGAVWLIWQGRAWRWDWTGYTPAPMPKAPAECLTPPTIRAVLAAGYRITPHPSLTDEQRR